MVIAELIISRISFGPGNKYSVVRSPEFFGVTTDWFVHSLSLVENQAIDLCIDICMRLVSDWYHWCHW